MAAAFIAIGVMITVLVMYGMRDDAPPTTTPLPAGKPALAPTTSLLPKTDDPHAGAEHHTAEAQKHEGGMPSPLQVFATAKLGDWTSYRVTTESSMAQTFTAIGIERITAADDKQVSRSFSGRVEQTGEVRNDRYEDRPRQGLTLDQLTTNDVGGWTIYKVVVTDDVREVGGRKFKCKKISYESNDPLLPKKRTHTDLWISDEVPNGGLVEEIEVQELPNLRFRLSKQVLGFGDAKSTAWGQKPDGL